MRALIQRVSSASVNIEGNSVGDIGTGLLVLLGVSPDDDIERGRKLADRLLNYRVFPDDQQRINCSLKDIDGDLLIVSQFTLCADTKKGLRPEFSMAAPPELAESLYKDFVEYCESQVGKVGTGIFGADMQVSLVNDGPVTFLLES
jgi:D-tyrosyl-tRNA(Tyr) deacylase